MLQIDYIYEFFYQEIFKNFDIFHLPGGVPVPDPVASYDDITLLNRNFTVFNSGRMCDKKILFYDQEPLLNSIVEKYLDQYTYLKKFTLEELKVKYNVSDVEHRFNSKNPNTVYQDPACFCVSEYSEYVNELTEKYNLKTLYYFFHGFAALDWFRGYYALNYIKKIVKTQKDFITFNRSITGDRSYRIYFISQLVKHGLLEKGLVSFGVSDDGQHWRDELEHNTESKLSEHATEEIWNHLSDLSDRLVVDQEQLPGSASADIPRTILGIDCPGYDALWHIVTETVFYYNKLHLTEKIFKPIVSKQPFMLLAAPGNLAYLKSYGFRTFAGIIDESYDDIQDNDARIDAVVKQLKWYCNLSHEEKNRVIEAIAPIVEYNFQHFYGKFKEIITDELLNNTKTLFKELEYDDSDVNYTLVKTLLTS